jgi:hypothetical protein
MPSSVETMTLRIPDTTDGEQVHAVRFYEDDASLGRLVPIDANEALAGFMVEGMPGALADICRQHTHVVSANGGAVSSASASESPLELDPLSRTA